MCVFFTLTDRASNISSTIRGCQSGTVSGLLDRKRSEEHLQSFSKSMELKDQKQNKNDKKIGTTTQSTCQKKILIEERSIRRVWYTASREPSDTPPPRSQLSRICTQRHITYNSVLSGFQASLSTQSTPLEESLGRSNQRGSKRSQACYSHPRFNLNLVLVAEETTVT